MKNGAVLCYENCYNIDKVMSCRNTRFRSWKSGFFLHLVSALHVLFKTLWENERRQRIDTLISFRKCKYSLPLKLKQHLKVVSKHELVSAPNLFNRRQIDISIKSAFADDTFNINLAQSNAIFIKIPSAIDENRFQKLVKMSTVFSFACETRGQTLDKSFLVSTSYYWVSPRSVIKLSNNMPQYLVA